MLVGVFQNFDYFDSDSIFASSSKIPYKISAAASFGGGILYSLTNEANTVDMNLGLHLNAILMGASITDYSHHLDRNYSLGSGIGSKAFSQIRFKEVGSFNLGVELYHLSTWNGYPPSDEIVEKEAGVNAQGDKGYTNLIIINPRMEFYMSKALTFNMELFTHIRNSHYDYFPDVRFHTFEVKGSIVYKY